MLTAAWIASMLSLISQLMPPVAGLIEYTQPLWSAPITASPPPEGKTLT